MPLHREALSLKAWGKKGLLINYTTPEAIKTDVGFY